MLKGIKSLIAGIAAGTALGMLFAPKKGEETRKNIQSEVKEGGTGLHTVKKTLLAMGQDFGETCKEAYDEVNEKESVQKARKGAKKAYKKNVSPSTRKKVKKAVSDAKRVVKRAKKTIKKKK